MSDFDWRSWMYQRLSTFSEITDVVGDRIIGAGGLEGSVNEKPFIVLLMDPETPGPFPGASTSGGVVAVHDEPGDYLRTDTLLRAVRRRLSGQVGSPGAVACQWLGDSQDLSDESLGTIYRTSTFGFAGLEGNP